MSDEVFRQVRKKISPEDFAKAPVEEGNPLESVQAIQRAVAKDRGDNEESRDKPLFSNPDAPFQIAGNMPPGFREALQPGSSKPSKMHRPMRQSPLPEAQTSKLRTTGSDELEDLLSRLEPHISWEEVELPSKGKFYDNVPGTLHIRPMTGEEEQILATPRFVRKGKAIDMIFAKCIREPINTQSLLSIDRTYILIFLRGISYTPEYDVEIKCPECTMKYNTVIDLNQLEVDGCPPDFTPSSLSGHLPTTGFSYKYRLASGEDEQAITRYREMRVKEYGDQNEDDTLLYRTALLLENIEGVREKAELNLLIKRLPINDVAHLRNTLNDMPFGVDTNVGQVCPSCMGEFEIELPLEANFFFPRKKKERTPQ